MRLPLLEGYASQAEKTTGLCRVLGESWVLQKNTIWLKGTGPERKPHSNKHRYTETQIHRHADTQTQTYADMLASQSLQTK